MISYLLYLLIAAAGIALFLDKREPAAKEQPAVLACANPVTFNIGEIDERFDLSPDHLRRFLNGAGKLWSDAAGPEYQLFEFDPEGDVSVHLIYDERQQMIEEEKSFSTRIQMKSSRLDRLQRSYSRSGKEYEKALGDYNSFLEQYRLGMERHNDRVESWNETGGPDQQKDQLLDNENKLARMKDRLAGLQNEVNRAGERLETMREQLNGVSGEKDALIEEYNERFAGEYRFSQGEYDNSGEQPRINIYHYKSLNHLRLVLAHEVGHALGLGHVESPESVMYSEVEAFSGSSVRLSGTDIAAIQSRCRNPG
ncbi:MAG: matrixin family metalloprotease [Balneolaceae bacterium]